MERRVATMVRGINVHGEAKLATGATTSALCRAKRFEVVRVDAVMRMWLTGYRQHLRDWAEWCALHRRRMRLLFNWERKVPEEAAAAIEGARSAVQYCLERCKVASVQLDNEPNEAVQQAGYVEFLAKLAAAMPFGIPLISPAVTGRWGMASEGEENSAQFRQASSIAQKTSFPYCSAIAAHGYTARDLGRNMKGAMRDWCEKLLGTSRRPGPVRVLAGSRPIVVTETGTTPALSGLTSHEERWSAVSSTLTVLAGYGVEEADVYAAADFRPEATSYGFVSDDGSARIRL